MLCAPLLHSFSQLHVCVNKAKLRCCESNCVYVIVKLVSVDCGCHSGKIVKQQKSFSIITPLCCFMRPGIVCQQCRLLFWQYFVGQHCRAVCQGCWHANIVGGWQFRLLFWCYCIGRQCAHVSWVLTLLADIVG